MPPEKIPPARVINDQVAERLDGIYEVNPDLMRHTTIEDMPAWDSRRIVQCRAGYLAWVHGHFADSVWIGGRTRRATTPNQHVRRDPPG